MILQVLRCILGDFVWEKEAFDRAKASLIVHSEAEERDLEGVCLAHIRNDLFMNDRRWWLCFEVHLFFSGNHVLTDGIIGLLHQHGTNCLISLSRLCVTR